MEEKPMQTFGDEMNAQKELIEASIRRYGNEHLVEDKSLEILTAMVYRKIALILPAKRGDDEEEPDSEMTLSSLLTIAGIVMSALMIIFLFKPELLGFDEAGKPKPAKPGVPGVAPVAGEGSSALMMPGTQSGVEGEAKTDEAKTDEAKAAEAKKYDMETYNGKTSIVVSPFEFRKASEVYGSEYCGREENLTEAMKFVKTYINHINTKDKKYLDKHATYLNANFTLLGPPGTGKTLFVHYLIVKVDMYLKEKHLQKTNAKLYRDLSVDKAKLDAYLEDQMESRVLFCEVSSGTVFNMYVGNSEKNIKLLFDTAKAFTKRPNGFEAVILFFDEGEVFFGARNSGGGNPSDAAVKSELLQRIGVRSSDEYRPIFVVCATNMFDTFDAAFKRRLGSHIRFDLPNEEERRKFVVFTFKDFGLLDNEIDMIVQLTKGRSQSFFPKYMNQFCIKNDDYTIIGFELRRYIEYLYENRDNMSLV